MTVPSRALGILPHFAVVAHEFGHAIYDDFRPTISQKFSDHRDSLKSVYNSYSDEVSVRIGKDLSDTYIRSITDTILDNWTQEIACDAISFCLTGPASFFALSDILQFASANFLFNETHPPKVLRRNFLYNLMSQNDNNFVKVISEFTGDTVKEDFNSVLMPKLPNPGMLFRALRNKRSDEVAAVLAELPSVIIHQGPLICEAVVQEFRKNAAKKQLFYTVNQFECDLKTHLSVLLDAIPPIETGINLEEKSPTDFRTILNVGWVALLCKLDELNIDTSGVPSHLLYGAKAEALHGLLLKAVELSEIRRQWKDI